MPIYHLDCASGIAGDMFLGACLDLGMPLDVVRDAVDRLGLPGVGVESRRALRGGMAGTRFRVLVEGRPVEGPDPEERAAGESTARHSHESDSHSHAHSHASDHAHGEAHHHPAPSREGAGAAPSAGAVGQRSLNDILALLRRSSLTAPIRERAVSLFRKLGEAEAKVHGVDLESIHFHEVGAVDSIVDLVGAAAAVEYLAADRITCGAVNVGNGRVRTAHGDLPVPAPATAELLHGIPVYGGPEGELTTPTGAVLLATLVHSFGEMPPLRLLATGYGLGRKHLPLQANALRLHRGERAAQTGASPASDLPQVAVVECEVDDLPGEAFGFLMERLLAEGALDVFFTPVQMKKNRPGTLVTLLCRPEQLATLAGLLLMESGSLGCRYHLAARFEAERAVVEVDTAYGRIRVKQARWDGRALAAAPEYEDCRRLALASGVPWREVYYAALRAVGSLGLST